MLYLDYSREIGRVGAERVRRPRGPGRGLVLQGAERGAPRQAPRGDGDRGGVDRLARRLATDVERRARASRSSGTWAGCTTPSATWQKEPVHRRYHHDELTFSLVYAWDENFVLPLSHDEVVHGKRLAAAEDAGRRVAAVREPPRAVRLHVGASRQAAAVHGRASSRRATSGRRAARSTGTCSTIPRHAGVQRLVSRPQPRLPGRAGAVGGRLRPRGVRVARRRRARRQRGRVRASQRADGARWLVCLVNLSPAVREGWQVPLPVGGTWREVLNTDAEAYGGANVGNLGAIDADAGPLHGRPFSARSRCRRSPPSGSRPRTTAA